MKNLLWPQLDKDDQSYNKIIKVDRMLTYIMQIYFMSTNPEALNSELTKVRQDLEKNKLDIMYEYQASLSKEQIIKVLMIDMKSRMKHLIKELNERLKKGTYDEKMFVSKFLQTLSLNSYIIETTHDMENYTDDELIKYLDRQNYQLDEQYLILYALYEKLEPLIKSVRNNLYNKILKYYCSSIPQQTINKIVDSNLDFAQIPQPYNFEIFSSFNKECNPINEFNILRQANKDKSADDLIKEKQDRLDIEMKKTIQEVNQAVMTIFASFPYPTQNTIHKSFYCDVLEENSISFQIDNATGKYGMCRKDCIKIAYLEITRMQLIRGSYLLRYLEILKSLQGINLNDIINKIAEQRQNPNIQRIESDYQMPKLSGEYYGTEL